MIASNTPTVVCQYCAKVVRCGTGRAVSHGFCSACLYRYDPEAWDDKYCAPPVARQSDVKTTTTSYRATLS